MQTPPTLGTEASLAPHLSGARLGCPLSSVSVCRCQGLGVPRSDPRALPGSWRLCIAPPLLRASALPAPAQDAPRAFWQLRSRAGLVTARPSAGCCGNASVKQLQPLCQGRRPGPERKWGWGLGRAGVLAAPWGTLDACLGVPGGCSGGWGGAERGGKGCPASSLQAVPQHPVSGWSRPEAGAAWPQLGGAGTWALWALNPTASSGSVYECLSCCPNPAAFPLCFSPARQPSSSW